MNEKKKVFNWETVELTSDQLLQACLEAFNELPNKRLKNNSLGTTTYNLASAIEGYKGNKKDGET